jgi:hypothetical protein
MMQPRMLAYPAQLRQARDHFNLGFGFMQKGCRL